MRQTAEVSGLEVSNEQDEAVKRRKLTERDSLLTKFGAPEVLGLPTAWRGKSYRRVEQAGDGAGRQRAEEKERARWGREVAQILLDAGLPFGQELKTRGLGSEAPEAARCL